MKIVYFLLAIGLVFVVFQSFRAVSASKIETQKYRLVKLEEGFELNCKKNPSVTINTNTYGIAIADAVLFVPVKK